MKLPAVKSNARSVRRFRRLLRENVRLAGGTTFSAHAIDLLTTITKDFGFSFKAGELQIIDGNWYVTHTGLLRLARRKKCRGIHIEAVDSLCDSAMRRFVLKATVYPSKSSSGFVGYGDADPSNVSFHVQGAEMRVAETRAVNRALRKAYGIGICSVEEIGSRRIAAALPRTQKLPPQPANGNGNRSRVLKFGTVYANSSASINSIPTWSRHMRPTFAESRSSVTQPASKSKASSPTLPSGPRKTAMPCSANSTATRRKKVPHETPNHRFIRRRSLCRRSDPGRGIPGSRATSSFSSPGSKGLLHAYTGHPGADPLCR